MLAAHERHHGYAHVERLQRSVRAAVGHRVEREIHQRVARLVFRVVSSLRQHAHTGLGDADRGEKSPVDGASLGGQWRDRQQRARNPLEHFAPERQAAPRQLERVDERADDDRVFVDAKRLAMKRMIGGGRDVPIRIHAAIHGQQRLELE